MVTCCLSVCGCCHFSCIWLFATPWTVAIQAPLSWDSPGKNTEVGCYTLLQGIFLTLGLNLGLISPALASVFFTTNYYSHLTENWLRGVQQPQNSKWGNQNQSWSFMFLLYHTLLISITDTKNINNFTLASIYSQYPALVTSICRFTAVSGLLPFHPHGPCTL